jgi:hypothetical protein
MIIIHKTFETMIVDGDLSNKVFLNLLNLKRWIYNIKNHEEMIEKIIFHYDSFQTNTLINKESSQWKEIFFKNN